jgi:Gamma-glutamyltranspeptidase
VEFTTRPELKGTFGMVSSTHWLASGCGMSVLERGGNAFDAAVAAGFVLQVVEPHLNGPGGEVPMVLWDATRRKPEVLCGQGPTRLISNSSPQPPGARMPPTFCRIPASGTNNYASGRLRVSTSNWRTLVSTSSSSESTSRGPGRLK